MNLNKVILIIIFDLEYGDAISKYWLQKFLPKENILICSDSEEAIELINLNKIDLVIVNLRMPGISGEELIDYIQDKFAQIPIIALSGHTKSLEALRNKKISSVKNYFEYPLDEEALTNAVKCELAV